MRPTLEELIADKEQDKQRAAAEMIAGILNGSKHWPIHKQQTLWSWLAPFITQIFSSNLKTDTLQVWTSFLEYMFYRKDPRRPQLQPLLEHVLAAFHELDFDAELSFDVVKILSLCRACYEELGMKFTPWVDEVLERCWKEIWSDHDEVRAYIGEILAFSDRIKVRIVNETGIILIIRQSLPRPSVPTCEAFVKECRILPLDYDIMGMRGTFHKGKIQELVDNFKVWREDRVPGARAFQSRYDRQASFVIDRLSLLTHLQRGCNGMQMAFPVAARHTCDWGLRLYSAFDGTALDLTAWMHS